MHSNNRIPEDKNEDNETSIQAGLSILKKYDISNEPNIAAVRQAGKFGQTVAGALCQLSRAGLLTNNPAAEANRSAVIQAGENASLVAGGLIQLHQAGLLEPYPGGANRKAVIAAGDNAFTIGYQLAERYRKELLEAKANPAHMIIFNAVTPNENKDDNIELLEHNNLSNDANIAAVRKAKEYGYEVALALIQLNREELLTDDPAGEANRSAVAQAGANVYGVLSGLIQLHQAGLLEPYPSGLYRNLVIRAGVNINSVVLGLIQLNNENLLTDDPAGEANRDAVIQSGHNALTIAISLIRLKQAKLLNDPEGAANRAAVIQAGENATQIVTELIRLNKIGLLTGPEGVKNRAALIQVIQGSQGRENAPQMTTMIIEKYKQKNDAALGALGKQSSNPNSRLSELPSEVLINIASYFYHDTQYDHKLTKEIEAAENKTGPHTKKTKISHPKKQ